MSQFVPFQKNPETWGKFYENRVINHGKIFEKWVDSLSKSYPKSLNKHELSYFCLQKCLKLNYLMYISLRWKCCFCIKKTQELPGASSPGTPQGALPLDPTGAFKRAPGPHVAKARERCALQFFALCASAYSMGHPAIPCPGAPSNKVTPLGPEDPLFTPLL